MVSRTGVAEEFSHPGPPNSKATFLPFNPPLSAQGQWVPKLCRTTWVPCPTSSLPWGSPNASLLHSHFDLCSYCWRASAAGFQSSPDPGARLPVSGRAHPRMCVPLSSAHPSLPGAAWAEVAASTILCRRSTFPVFPKAFSHSVKQFLVTPQ